MDWFELAAVWRSVFKFADWSRRVDYNRDAGVDAGAGAGDGESHNAQRCWEFNQKCQRQHNISNCKGCQKH